MTGTGHRVGRGTRRAPRVVVAVATFLLGAVGVSTPLAADAPSTAVGTAARADLEPVPGTGAPRPRLLFDPGSEADLVARLGREPYRTLFVRSHDQATGWEAASTLGDLTGTNQLRLHRAAKVRAFEYALDRTASGGAAVPFADADARRAAGDAAVAVLLQMLDRSRLAVPAPIGGWDRDITSSEEIVMAAQTYDLLAGTGYPFAPDDEAEIVRRIAAATRELRLNFVDPSTASGYATLHQNNHRTKTGTALVVAAVALADQVPDAREWFDTGADLVDDTLRYVLLTGDGAYAEGPFYWRFSTQNVVAYLAVWERFLGHGSWTTESGLVLPALVDHPLLARNHRWMLDTAVPDGTMAPIDDGNPGRSFFHGVLPDGTPTLAAGYWQWARTPQPYDIDGNISLGPDAIVAYDDSIDPAPPDWEPSQVYVEGGTATLRSGWDGDATMALVLGEHDTASEFGRDRTGAGRWPQSHEHAEPGSFMLYAHGERLALDPGYLTFATHSKVNRPEHHNVVLVDGSGPADYLGASIAWATDTAGRPPAEGQSTLSGFVRSDVADGVTVSTAYRGAHVERRTLLLPGGVLVVADAVAAPEADELTWMLHGNGGGTSGGAYEATPTGGRWTIGGARLDAAVSVSTGAPTLSTVEATHEVPYTQERTHTALSATAPAAAPSTEPSAAVGAVQVLVPTAADAAAPTLSRPAIVDHAAVEVASPDGGTIGVVRRGSGSGLLAIGRVVTDGDLLVVERDVRGGLVAVWADGAHVVATADGVELVSDAAGTLAWRADGVGGAHVVADTTSPTVRVTQPGAAVVGVDGACGASTTVAGTTSVSLNADPTARLLATAAPASPAADAGPDVRVDPGTSVVLDGRASCDADGDALTPSWELVSAPAGSTWSLTGGDGWRPVLTADRVGPYRVRLVVTDATGRRSDETEVLVIAGAQCADGVDDDLDGLIDSDDPDCDGPPSPAPRAVGDWAVPWVTNVYRDFLGREPDAAGLAWWVAALDEGGTRSDLLIRLRGSAEARRRMVADAFATHLGRAPSAGDLAYWSGFLAHRRHDQMVVELLTSAEFAARAAGRGVIGFTYEHLVGRAPTREELVSAEMLVYFQGRRAFVVRTFHAAEAAGIRVDQAYARLLHRSPDLPGRAYWVDRLAAGTDQATLLLALAASPEYAARPA